MAPDGCCVYLKPIALLTASDTIGANQSTLRQIRQRSDIQLRQLNLAVNELDIITIGLRISRLQYPVETFTAPYDPCGSGYQTPSTGMKDDEVPVQVFSARDVAALCRINPSKL